MRSTLSAVLKGLALAGLLVLSFVFFFPEYRYSLWGVKLLYQAPVEEKRNLVVDVQIMEGREVRGPGAPQDAVGLADSAKLDASLEETTLGPGSEFLLDYKLTQVRSEQFAWNQPKPGKLSGFHWQGRVSNRGNLGGVKLEERSNALWARENVAWTWMGSLWPPLPGGRVRPGEIWTGELRAFCVFPEKPDGFALVMRPTFTLDRVFREDGKTFAEYHWEGQVAGDGSVGLTITGDCKGKAVNSVEDQRCLAAEFSVEMKGEAPVVVRGSEGDAMKIAWHQKVTGRVYRTLPAPAAPAAPKN